MLVLKGSSNYREEKPIKQQSTILKMCEKFNNLFVFISFSKTEKDSCIFFFLIPFQFGEFTYFFYFQPIICLEVTEII